MSNKTFVLDTNVFLHDPSALVRFDKQEVVVALSVLEELDSMKRNSGERGKNARNVLRYIDSLKLLDGGNKDQGVTLEQGTKIKLILDKKFEKLNGFPLALDSHSNRIIHVAYALKQQGQRPVFVSKDFVSRVKAEAMGLEVEDYENFKISYTGVQKGIKKLNVEKSVIDHFYKEGVFKTDEKDFAPNEYCLLVSQENSSAICRFNKKTEDFQPLVQMKRGVWGIHPLNVEQRCAMDLLLRDDIQLVTLVGPAGTGKTLLALACGMTKVFDENVYNRILVSRPIMPLGKDIGYLPGTKEEKLYHWMQPIYDNLEFLCDMTNGEGNGRSTLDWIQESKKLEMEAVTYIRGRTLPKIYMIIDEAQNLTPHEMKTIISRAGKGTKVILTGDPTQIDNPYLDKDSNGLTYVVNQFRDESVHGHIFLDKSERSELAAIAAKLMK